MGPRNDVLDVGARWRRLAHTTERSVCGGDATLRQITVTVTHTALFHHKRVIAKKTKKQGFTEQNKNSYNNSQFLQFVLRILTTQVGGVA